MKKTTFLTLRETNRCNSSHKLHCCIVKIVVTHLHYQHHSCSLIKRFYSSKNYSDILMSQLPVKQETLVRRPSVWYFIVKEDVIVIIYE